MFGFLFGFFEDQIMKFAVQGADAYSSLRLVCQFRKPISEVSLEFGLGVIAALFAWRAVASFALDNPDEIRRKLRWFNMGEYFSTKPLTRKLIVLGTVIAAVSLGSNMYHDLTVAREWCFWPMCSPLTGVSDGCMAAIKNDLWGTIGTVTLFTSGLLAYPLFCAGLVGHWLIGSKSPKRTRAAAPKAKSRVRHA